MEIQSSTNHLADFHTRWMELSVVLVTDDVILLLPYASYRTSQRTKSLKTWPSGPGFLFYYFNWFDKAQYQGY